jgi:predicted AlkP superfamily pyrophosphatase or phosphodiesterase
VLVLSWDGLRHDYPDLDEFPGLKRLEHEGVRAKGLRAGWPSNTFPGHVSMATGTYADRHGIVDNRFYDRERGIYSYSSDADWLEAEPLWIAAERQGVRAATYFWVGSESDWRGQRQTYRIAPFDGGRLEALKVDQILAWLGLNAADRPQLIMSYWAGVDSTGHDYGPGSQLLAGQLAGQDYQLQRLMRGIDELQLWPQLTLILVSDHGMTLTGPAIDLAGALRRQQIEARVFGGAVVHVFLNDPDQQQAAASVAQEVIAGECADARLYVGAELPAEMRLAYPNRTGDLVVIAPPPCNFSFRPGFGGWAQGALANLGWGFGSHGYDPMLPDMAGVFMAMGRGVPADQPLGEVRQIDLAATVSRLLGIEPPLQSEGEPIW